MWQHTESAGEKEDVTSGLRAVHHRFPIIWCTCNFGFCGVISNTKTTHPVAETHGRPSQDPGDHNKKPTGYDRHLHPGRSRNVTWIGKETSRRQFEKPIFTAPKMMLLHWLFLRRSSDKSNTLASVTEWQDSGEQRSAPPACKALCC